MQHLRAHKEFRNRGAAAGLVSRLAIVFLLALFLTHAGGWSAHAAPTIITSTQIKANDSITRFEATLSRAAGFNVYVVRNPFRVIIDIRDATFDLPPSAGATGKGLITGYRFGQLGAGRSRMVIDTSGPVLIKRSVAVKAKNGKPARLIVDLIETDYETFLQIHKADEMSNLVAASKAETPASPDEEVIPRELPPISANSAKYTDANQLTSLIKSGKVPLPRPNPRRKAAITKSTGGTAPAKKTKPVIVIDPGHGGIDPGAIAKNGTREKDIALNFSRLLKSKIEKTGRYKVVLTRNDDSFLKLRERIRIARDNKANLFIAVHADSVRSRRARGTTFYTLSDTASDEEAAELARKENKADIIGGVDLAEKTNEVTNILIELAQRETNNHSIYFARKGVARLKKVTRMNRRPMRSAGFIVLKAPDVPSVLLELGFLSNRADARLLTSKKWQTRIATALTHAIQGYFHGQVALKK